MPHGREWTGTENLIDRAGSGGDRVVGSPDLPDPRRRMLTLYGRHGDQITDPGGAGRSSSSRTPDSNRFLFVDVAALAQKQIAPRRAAEIRQRRGARAAQSGAARDGRSPAWVGVLTPVPDHGRLREAKA